jgi:cation diffusion facilitator family transporter
MWRAFDGHSLGGMNGTLAHKHGPWMHDHHHHGPHRHARLPFRSAEPGEHPVDEHGHSHGLVDRSIIRSRAGVRAVAISLAVLAVTAGLQVVVFVFSGSVALLADLIHNAGDALTAIPLGVAFLVRSRRGERWAGYVVVGVIFISAAVAAVEAVERLIHPQTLDYLGALAIAGALGFVGNEITAQVRLRAGHRLESPALIADGHHARVDGFVSLGVIASAGAAWFGIDRADPLIGLAISVLILRITWQAWQTVRNDHAH